MGRRSLTRRGANAVEFAIIMPIWVLGVFGTLEYGWCSFVQSTLERAVSTGARHGAMADPRDGEATARRHALHTWTSTGLASQPIFEGRIVGASPNESFQFDGRVAYDPLVGLPILPVPSELRASTQRLLEDR